MRSHAFILPLAALVLGGCSSTPPGATSGGQTLVTFQAVVAGTVDPAGYYYIVLDTNNNPADGPVPVVGPPWGNGYAAGSYTHYILYHGGRFEVHQSSDPTHTTDTYLGPPLQAGLASSSASHPNDTLVVTLDRAQIANVYPNVSALDVNMITTDRIVLDPQQLTKVVDGLGASGNDYVTIPLTFTTVYANGVDPDPGHPEGPRDAPGLAENPNLDLVNWRITVQTSG